MIYNKYLSFSVLYLFIISILGHLILEVESFTPLGRVGHSSVNVGNKLYFFGGVNGNDRETLKQVFYLNVSQSFNVSNPPWVDLTTTAPAAAMPFGNVLGTSVLGDIDKDPNIYLFGGIMVASQNSVLSILYTFNLNTSKWSRPEVKGKEPESRGSVKSVIDNTGKIYIFGGANISSTTTLRYFDEMVILNTADSTWSTIDTINLPNAPTGRIEYTATLLPSGVIVYIGGLVVSKSSIVEISQLNLYNTNSSTWSVMTAKLKDSVDSRHLHTAVLTSDGNIIIYGGVKIVVGLNGIVDVQATPDLAVLNTNTQPFEWTVPKVSSNVGTVPPLFYHTADLVGNNMIVAFGNVTQSNAEPLKYNPNIYVMDIKSYTWVDTFESSDNKLTTGKIVGITIGVILGIAFLVGLGFLIRRWKKMKNENSTTTGCTLKRNSSYNLDATTANNSPYNQDVISVNNSPYNQGVSTVNNSLYNQDTVNNSPYNIYNQDVLESSNRSSIV